MNIKCECLIIGEYTEETILKSNYSKRKACNAMKGDSSSSENDEVVGLFLNNALLTDNKKRNWFVDPRAT